MKRYGLIWVVMALLLMGTSTATQPPPIPTPFFIHMNLVRRVICSGGTIGTAAVISNSQVVTAAHVIRGQTSCTIDAEPVTFDYVDNDLDVAVLGWPNRIPTRFFINCNPMRAGDGYFSVGYAFGSELVVQNLIATDNYENIRMSMGAHGNILLRHIRTLRGNIYRGMSGGPIVDENGLLVGINNTTHPEGLPIAGSRELRETYLCANRT